MILFVLALIIFLIFEFIMFFIRKVVHGRRVRKERATALADSLVRKDRLTSSSLVRTSAPRPQARMLCLSTDAKLLDQLRSWLVLDGCAVDTIDRPAEFTLVLGEYHYDFVVIDEMLPDMHATEVLGLARRTRPDIDLILISEVAEAPWKEQGVAEVISRKISESDFLDTIHHAIALREERITVHLNTKVSVAAVDLEEHPNSDGFAIPGGVFISREHCWSSLQQDGAVLVGLDDFARKLIGDIDGIEMPNLGMTISVGQILFRVRQGYRTLPFASPVSGTVKARNTQLQADPSMLHDTPYGKNWICSIDATDFDDVMPGLRIGHSAVLQYEQDIERMREFLGCHVTSRDPSAPLRVGELSKLNDDMWQAVAKEFFLVGEPVLAGRSTSSLADGGQ